MTQEDKELLFKDISARLPYGIKCFTKYGALPISKIYDDGSAMFAVKSLSDNKVTQFGYCIPQPYLRPMSSMTEEETIEYASEWDKRAPYGVYPACDWLNAHYFDYRGLIEKGLALEAPEGMYS